MVCFSPHRIFFFFFLRVWLQENVSTVVYPKKRLTALKTLQIFSHQDKKEKSCLQSYRFLCFDVGLELWRTRMITYSPNQGWSFTGVNGSRCFCHANSGRPGFYKAIEHLLNALITSRLREINIWIMLSKIVAPSVFDNVHEWIPSEALHFKQLH